MNIKLAVVGILLAMSASTAMATHPVDAAYDNGAINSGEVAGRAVVQGTFHPGHVAIFATGHNGEEKYNTPATDFHLDGTPYASGPGGYGAQQSGRD